eukprot:scaffold109_cov252-Pinguiococcus_pyrenoidosus.AAC.56
MHLIWPPYGYRKTGYFRPAVPALRAISIQTRPELARVSRRRIPAPTPRHPRLRQRVQDGPR